VFLTQQPSPEGCYQIRVRKVVVVVVVVVIVVVVVVVIQTMVMAEVGSTTKIPPSSLPPSSLLPPSSSLLPSSLQLFIDGSWRIYNIDDHLPVSTTKRSSSSSSSGGGGSTKEELAFSKAHEGQLWVPLLEKAYAKAHGSYGAISGGWIAEAMFDLTSRPTGEGW